MFSLLPSRTYGCAKTVIYRGQLRLSHPIYSCSRRCSCVVIAHLPNPLRSGIPIQVTQDSPSKRYRRCLSLVAFAVICSLPINSPKTRQGQDPSNSRRNRNIHLPISFPQSLTLKTDQKKPKLDQALLLGDKPFRKTNLAVTHLYARLCDTGLCQVIVNK